MGFVKLEKKGHIGIITIDRQEALNALNIIAASDLKDAPPDFVPDHAEQYCGFYLYCPEDAERSASEKKRSRPERKEAER